MVDSDPGALPAADAVAAAPEAPTTATTALPVLAKGHLHPAILLLRLFDALQRAVFPVVAGLVLPGYRWLLAVGAVLFVLQLGYALARYLTLEYTLTAAELRIREGLLERQERRIPLDRIQDLGFESTLLRRFLGLAVVLVETASGRGVEARLDALGRADAEHLREVLLAARAAAVAAPAVGATDEIAAPAAPEPEWLVHRSTTGELLLRGLTDLRLSAFVLTGFAALRASSEFDFVFRLAGVGQSLRGWIGQFPPLMIGLILLGLLAIVVLFGVLATMIGNLVQFHGFALTLRGDVLQRRFGLLTTRQKTLPRPRIQRVTYEQPWLRRLLGVGVVKADSAGGSRVDGEDTTGGWDVVVPLLAQPKAQAMLPALLPSILGEAFAVHSGSSRLVARMAIQGLLLAALVVAAWWPWSGRTALLGLLVVPLWALLGVLVWRNLGYALGERTLLLQHGIIGRTTAWLPTDKVQAVVLRQGPLAQLLGLADLTIYVAGGSPTRVPDLLAADARALVATIGERAAIAAARDWQGR
jgi:putative membrane protein